MAIAGPVPVSQHFDPARFDALGGRHGTPALWFKSRLCPCIDPRTGHALLTCKLCEEGIIWAAPEPITIQAFGRQRHDVYDDTGQRVEGLSSLTFPSTMRPGHLDKIQLESAEMVVNNEVHVRGELDPANRSTERLRVRPALSVESCAAIVPPPPATNGVLTEYAFFTDFTVALTGAIVWNVGHGPAPGNRYTLRYRARPTWVLWSPTSRDEHSVGMPYKAPAQRYDFFRRKAVGEA